MALARLCALYKDICTIRAIGGYKIVNDHLVKLVTDGHSLVDCACEKGFMMLVLCILEADLGVLGYHQFVLILRKISCSHLKSKYQIIIFNALQFINSYLLIFKSSPKLWDCPPNPPIFPLCKAVLSFLKDFRSCPLLSPKWVMPKFVLFLIVLLHSKLCLVVQLKVKLLWYF